MKKIITIGLMCVFLSACTSVKVNHVSNDHQIDLICIQENTDVTFSGFLEAIKNRIEYHNIETFVYPNHYKPERCEYTLWYTALRSWDLVLYLSHAELRLFKNDQIIANATYHLNGKGGLTFSKYASTASKMDPVIDKLLNK